MQDQILDMLLKKDEITWQTILYDLVKTEQMNPWDIDISILANKYLETIRKLKEVNFFISGKVILASAILLKIKSNKLLEEDIAGFDQILFHGDDDINLLEDDLEIKKERIKLMENPRLTIKTPQSRKKKVSIQDLVNALEKALEVDRRRTLRKFHEQEIPESLKIPEKKIDISSLIKDVYNKVISIFKTKNTETVTFTELVSSNRKEDKILTFIPLLHLDNQEKIILEQSEPFSEINIKIIK